MTWDHKGATYFALLVGTRLGFKKFFFDQAAVDPDFSTVNFDGTYKVLAQTVLYVIWD
jgi:hypothetical protein